MGVDDDRVELLTALRAAHQPLRSLEPDALPDDLAAWREIIGDTTVVGIGEAVRGARSSSELRRFTHRMLRFAVDELDVRALVLEQHTLEAGSALDRFVATGVGRLEDALGECWAPWRTVEVRDVAEWLRSRNARHPQDQVRMVGAISEDELGLAGHVLDWQRHVGGRVVYWGGAAHSAVAPADDTTYPPRSPPGMSDGARLRGALGSGYVSVGCICDHAVAGEPLPSPPRHFAEAPLAALDTAAWYLDLRRPGNDALRRWADSSATTRLIGPRYDPGHNGEFCMSGSSFGEWFDAIAYVREITPARSLS